MPYKEEPPNNYLSIPEDVKINILCWKSHLSSLYHIKNYIKGLDCVLILEKESNRNKTICIINRHFEK